MKPTYFVRRAASPDPTHETLEAAQAKAEAMAESEPGCAFEILRCVGYSSTSKASTFWMDGEEPPESIPKLPVGAIGYCHYGNGQTAFCVAPEKSRYRMLEEGEPIADGDEFSRGYEWISSKCAGQQYKNVMHQPHRRPL